MRKNPFDVTLCVWTRTVSKETVSALASQLQVSPLSCVLLVLVDRDLVVEVVAE